MSKAGRHERKKLGRAGSQGGKKRRSMVGESKGELRKMEEREKGEKGRKGKKSTSRGYEGKKTRKTRK